jgi:hypothetical protein
MIERQNCNKLALFVLFAMVLASEAAHAGSRTIEVKQINPDGKNGTTTCDENTVVCTISIDVLSNDKHTMEPVTVEVGSSSDKNSILFKSTSDDLGAEIYAFYQAQAKHEHETDRIVTLIRPNPLSGRQQVSNLAVVRYPGNSFADLEIKIITNN